MREGEPTLTIPKGFTKGERLGGDFAKYATTSAYEAAGIAVPENGTFSEHAGTIAVADSNGEMWVWVSKEDNTGREVSHDDAVAALIAAGFKDVGSKFMCPTE